MGVIISYIEKLNDTYESFLLTTEIQIYPSYTKGDSIWIHTNNLSLYSILEVEHSIRKLEYSTELGLVVFVKRIDSNFDHKMREARQKIINKLI